MSGWTGRPGNGVVCRAPFPESTPPEINHVVLTGTLSADPQEGRSPTGDRAIFLLVEFPVADPISHKWLWTVASCEIEVPADLARRSAEELRAGAPVLVWGQLSERLVIERGRSSRRSVIVATLLKSGAST